MPARAANRAMETSTTTGTGTLTTLGAIDALHTTLIANIPSGTLVPYSIEHTTLDEYEDGWGVVTSGSLTRLSGSVEDSSNAGALVSFSSGTKNVWIGNPASQWCELPRLCDVRLSLESGVPISTTDQTAKTTLYAVPYKGCSLSLYNGSRWKNYNLSAQLSIAIPSQVYRIYDVFVYDNAGTLTLELNAWDSGGQTTGSITGASNASPVVLTANNTLSIGDLIGVNGTVTNTAPNGKVWYVSGRTSTTITLEGSVGNGASASGGTWYKIPTARTDALALQDGVYVKSADKTRRYLGTFMTTDTSGQCEDSTSRRYVWNMYNRVSRTLECFDTADSWNYSTAAFRLANASATLGVAVVNSIRGLDEDIATAWNSSLTVNGSGNPSLGVGINRNATNVARLRASTSVSAPASARYAGLPGLGFVSYQRLERGGAAGTSTFYGDNGGSDMQSALQVESMF